MAKYLDAGANGSQPPPDIQTQVRTNPRAKAILWSVVTGMAALTSVGLFIFHVR